MWFSSPVEKLTDIFITALRYRNNAMIDMRCQATIETHFFFTEMATFVERAEFEESEINGLLDFVDVTAG